MEIPFVDLKAQYRSLKSEIDGALARVVENASFILGPEVEAFEQEFAAYVGTRFCVGVNSGTAALQLAVSACEIGAGDEVIVPANTFFATAEAVSTAGARPVFVDSDPVSFTIDPSKIEASITPRTRAIVPVHIYGQPADLDAVFEIADRHGLVVIEDAAQAHGALYKGRSAGSRGVASCFSFYPGKNLGAYGEAGAVLTNDPGIAEKVRLMRNHGSATKYLHTVVGYNFRLEGIQAAVLRVKLAYLDKWNDRRRSHAKTYNALLKDSGVTLPREMDYARHVYHLFVIQAEERDELQKRLAALGIQTGIHYPIPLHMQPAYASFGHQANDFPVAARQAEQLLSLPMYPELEQAQIEYVCESIRETNVNRARA